MRRRLAMTADDVRAKLDDMSALDVLHCPDEFSPIEFANWLRDNNKRGCISWMPKGEFYSMYFKD